MSMISLNPGPLFREAGLNRTSTPVGPRATSAEIKEIFKRGSHYDDLNLPPDSPMAESYDIVNTSSKMLMVNKSMTNQRLRGHETRRPISADPERHFNDTTKKNDDRHEICLNSSSVSFEPKPKIRNMWVNQEMRPPWTPVENNFTDPRRHTSCRIPSDPAAFVLENRKRSSYKIAGTQKKYKKPPISMKDNQALLHPDISTANKRYMFFIAKTYDQTNMKQLKQLQYRDLVLRQQYLGFHSDEEYRKYMKYIEGPRKRQFGDSKVLFRSGQRDTSSSNRPLSSRTSYSSFTGDADQQSDGTQSLTSRSGYSNNSRINRPKTAPLHVSSGSSDKNSDTDNRPTNKSGVSTNKGDKTNRGQLTSRKSPRSISPRSKQSIARENMRRMAKEKKAHKSTTAKGDEKENEDTTKDSDDGTKTSAIDYKGQEKKRYTSKVSNYIDGDNDTKDNNEVRKDQTTDNRKEDRNDIQKNKNRDQENTEDNIQAVIKTNDTKEEASRESIIDQPKDISSESTEHLQTDNEEKLSDENKQQESKDEINVTEAVPVKPILRRKATDEDNGNITLQKKKSSSQESLSNIDKLSDIQGSTTSLAFSDVIDIPQEPASYSGKHSPVPQGITDTFDSDNKERQQDSSEEFETENLADNPIKEDLKQKDKTKFDSDVPTIKIDSETGSLSDRSEIENSPRTADTWSLNDSEIIDLPDVAKYKGKYSPYGSKTSLVEGEKLEQSRDVLENYDRDSVILELPDAVMYQGKYSPRGSIEDLKETPIEKPVMEENDEPQVHENQAVETYLAFPNVEAEIQDQQPHQQRRKPLDTVSLDSTISSSSDTSSSSSFTSSDESNEESYFRNNDQQQNSGEYRSGTNLRDLSNATPSPPPTKTTAETPVKNNVDMLARNISSDDHYSSFLSANDENVESYIHNVLQEQVRKVEKNTSAKTEETGNDNNQTQDYSTNKNTSQQSSGTTEMVNDENVELYVHNVLQEQVRKFEKNTGAETEEGDDNNRTQDYSTNKNISQQNDGDTEIIRSENKVAEDNNGNMSLESSSSSSGSFGKSKHKEGIDRPKTRLGNRDHAAAKVEDAENEEEDVPMPSASFYREGVDRPKSRGGRYLPKTQSDDDDDDRKENENKEKENYMVDEEDKTAKNTKDDNKEDQGDRFKPQHASDNNKYDVENQKDSNKMDVTENVTTAEQSSSNHGDGNKSMENTNAESNNHKIMGSPSNDNETPGTEEKNDDSPIIKSNHGIKNSGHDDNDVYKDDSDEKDLKDEDKGSPLMTSTPQHAVKAHDKDTDDSHIKSPSLVSTPQHHIIAYKSNNDQQSEVNRKENEANTERKSNAEGEGKGDIPKPNVKNNEKPLLRKASNDDIMSHLKDIGFAETAPKTKTIKEDEEDLKPEVKVISAEEKKNNDIINQLRATGFI